MEKEYKKMLMKIAIQLETLRDIQRICIRNVKDETGELNSMQSIITRLSRMNKQIKEIEG